MVKGSGRGRRRRKRQALAQTPVSAPKGLQGKDRTRNFVVLGLCAVAIVLGVAAALFMLVLVGLVSAFPWQVLTVVTGVVTLAASYLKDRFLEIKFSSRFFRIAVALPAVFSLIVGVEMFFAIYRPLREAAQLLHGVEISVERTDSGGGWRAYSFAFERGRDVADVVPPIEAALANTRTGNIRAAAAMDAGAYFLAGVQVVVRIRNFSKETIDIDGVDVEANPVPVPTGYGIIGIAPRQGAGDLIQKMTFDLDQPNPVPFDPTTHKDFFDTHAPNLEPNQSATFQIDLDILRSAAEAKVSLRVSSKSGKARIPLKTNTGKGVFRVSGFACVVEKDTNGDTIPYTPEQASELRRMRYAQVDEQHTARGEPGVTYKFVKVDPEEFADYCGLQSHSFAN